MGSLSNYLEKKLMDHVFKVATFTPPTNIYISLHTANPGELGVGSEVANSNNYSRVIHNNWNTASNRLADNNGDVTFPQASGNWGTCTHWALWDSGTYGSGNILSYGAFEESQIKIIVSGNIPVILSGDMNIFAVTGGITNYLANKLLDHFLKTAVYVQPTNLCLSIHNSSPGDSADVTEVANSNNYSRVIFNDWTTSIDDNGLISNNSSLSTPIASGGWNLCTHTGLWDNGSYGLGNLLWYGMIVPSQYVYKDDYIIWSAGQFIITID